MKKALGLTSLFVLFLCLSCKSDFEKIGGVWRVLDITYQGKSLMDSVYTDNGIYVKKNKEILLPNSYLYYGSWEFQRGTWEFLEKKEGVARLRIITPDTFINNIYNVKFYRDKEGNECLLLESQKTKIRCMGSLR